METTRVEEPTTPVAADSKLTATGPIPASRAIVYFALALLGCVTDLATKSWIFAKLGMPFSRPFEEQRIWVVRDLFSLTTSLNEGALFGVGQGKVFWFAGLSVFAAVAVVYWLFWAGAARDLWITVALGCITAGIFGNLYDRIGLPGLVWGAEQQGREGQPVYAVRDWLHFKVELNWPKNYILDWPVFNIADSLLVCGAIMLLWHAFRGKDDKKPSPAAMPSAKAA